MLEPVSKRRLLFREPNFMPKQQRQLSGAEIGTAVHLVMQHIDFSETGSVDEVRREIARLQSKNLLRPEQADAIRPAQIHRFFSSETGQRLLHADRAVREFRFSLLAPAERYFSGGAGEEVLLQGVIDCFFEEAGALTILDYKTDYVTDETLETTVQSYLPQLRAYRDALQRITGQPVSGAVLYFLGAELAIPLTFDETKSESDCKEC